MNHIDLWIDAQMRRLVDAAGNYVSEPPVFVRGDDLLLRIRFVDVNRAASPFVVTPRAFASGTQFFLSGKKTYGAATLLVFAENSTAWNQPGDWDETDPATGKCSCRVNFNGSELLTEVGSLDELMMVWDIDVIDPTGGITTLWRLRFALLNDVHRGNEGDPAPASPTYPTMGELDDRVAQGIELRIEDGALAVYVNGQPRGTI